MYSASGQDVPVFLVCERVQRTATK